MLCASSSMRSSAACMPWRRPARSTWCSSSKSKCRARARKSWSTCFTPSLRQKYNQPALWKALEDGSLSVVSTDDCPFRFADQKSLGKNDFSKIPNGGPGIENRLQILWHFELS